MTEDIRHLLAQQQWQITIGHIRASLALKSSQRETDSTAEWQNFSTAAEAFIELVEQHGWAE